MKQNVYSFYYHQVQNKTIHEVRKKRKMKRGGRIQAISVIDIMVLKQRLAWHYYSIQQTQSDPNHETLNMGLLTYEIKYNNNTKKIYFMGICLFIGICFYEYDENHLLII